MKKLLGLMLMAGITAMPVAARAADTDTGADMHKLDQRMENAADILAQIQGAKDKSIPDWIAAKAKCIAVVPGLVKGAFIVGAEYGQGVVSCRTPQGWSGPVFIRMAGGSFGFQIGGSGTDLILVATNHKGMQDLLQTKFKLGGTAAVAAGPVGREAQAATNLSMQAELLTYSRSHGVFAGVDLSGVTVSDNTDDTVALYGGKYHTFDQILYGHVPPPHNHAALHYMHVLHQYFGQATVQAQHHDESNNQPNEH